MSLSNLCFKKIKTENIVVIKVRSLFQLPLFLVVIFSVLGLALRYIGRAHISYDMSTFLIPWTEQIKSNGGLFALGSQIGDYNIPYQFLLAFMTYLPVRIEYSIKILSIIFDYLLAFSLGLLSSLIFNGSRFSHRVLEYVNTLYFVLGYSIVMFFPTVVLNSSFWGQCDSIYSFFIVTAIFCLFSNRLIICFVFLGLGFAFKLQTIFILPFFLFYYFKKEDSFSLIGFFLTVATFFAASFPGYLFGRPLSSSLKIYLNQTNEYPQMSMNFPSFWNLIGNDYFVLKKFAIIITFIILLVGFVVVLRFLSSQESLVDWLIIACWTSWTVVLFLPSMHERYSYLPFLMLSLLLIYKRSVFPVFIVASISELLTYGFALYATSFDLTVDSILMFVGFCYGSYLFLRYFLKKASFSK